MPIRPEQRHLYPTPAKWRAIRERILARAGHACEWCGVPNREHVWRRGDEWEPCDETESEGEATAMLSDGWRFVRIVLTIAHLDHDPTNNSERNLRALCQKCHLGYDAKHHARNAARTRQRKREAAGQRAMFNRETP